MRVCPDTVQRARLGGLVVLAYLGLSVAVTWPLAEGLTNALLGDPSGDTGVYVWNLWVFWHELTEHGRLPLGTDHVFAFTGGADFSLHNFTPLAGLAATPLIATLGAVGAYNLLTLAVLTIAASSVYGLGRHIGLRPLPGWMAGALFIASPVITARETAHFSLVTAAPLPLFVWALLRAVEQPSWFRAATVGAVVAIATYADAYYGVYCLLMGVMLGWWQFLRVEFRTRRLSSGTVTAISMLAAIIGCGVALRLVVGGTTVFVAGVRVGLSTLYTPMLLLLGLALLYLWLTRGPRVLIDDPDGRITTLAKHAVLAVATCLALLAPILFGLGRRFFQGRLPEVETYWRTSPRGVDLLSYFVPNPTSVWFGGLTRNWLLPETSDAFPEFVASFSLVAFVWIGVAATRVALPRMWVWFTGAFMAMSLGPFIHVAGMNTFILGPWALLRYVPVIEMARSPARLAIPAVLGLSLLTGFALQNGSGVPSRRRTMVMTLVVALLVVELTPVPRPLYSAAVPDIYDQIAGDPADGPLLELPSGLRDGTSSVGDFSARAQFHQTRHGRPLVGGYLSRISGWRKAENQRTPMLRVLHALSEGQVVPEAEQRAAAETREAFLARSCVRYVVVDTIRASAALRAFAVDALRLVPALDDGRYQVFVPLESPPCLPLRVSWAARSR